MKIVKIGIGTLILLFIFSCNSKDTADIKVTTTGNNIKSRIPAPPGYSWAEEESNSFGSFLQNIELKPHSSQILDHNGFPISNQNEHVAIINYDVGNRDLQQCADAVIRIRAEYLYERAMYPEIGFHFTSGHLFTWNQYKNGYRAVVNGNDVLFQQTQSANDSYQNFRKYLNAIYTYAGTISLNKETHKVTNDADIKAGDIIVTPGSPGHALIIVGKAINGDNKSVYLLAQGYTPAQSIHIITNNGEDINPWYELKINTSSTHTARYTFTPTNIRSFTSAE